MKNKLIISLCTFFVALSINAQTTVLKYTPGVTAGGVVYYLPKTVLKFAITATRTTSYPGDFHNYAKRFLRLNDVVTSAQTHWKIDNVKMVEVSAPDTSKVHVVELKKGTSAPLCTLTDNGVLLAINAQATKYEEPDFKMERSSLPTKSTAEII